MPRPRDTQQARNARRSCAIVKDHILASCRHSIRIASKQVKRYSSWIKTDSSDIQVLPTIPMCMSLITHPQLLNKKEFQLDSILVLMFVHLVAECFGVAWPKDHFSIRASAPGNFKARPLASPASKPSTSRMAKPLPLQQRLPMPRFAALPIAAMLAQMGQPAMASWVMLIFSLHI